MKLREIENLLYKYPSITTCIKNMEAELKELDLSIMDGFGVDYSKDRISPTYKISSVTENKALERIRQDVTKRKQEIENRISVAKSTLERLQKAIDTLAPEEKEILTMAYFRRYSYIQIAMEKNVSKSAYYRTKNNALERLKDALRY